MDSLPITRNKTQRAPQNIVTNMAAKMHQFRADATSCQPPVDGVVVVLSLSSSNSTSPGVSSTKGGSTGSVDVDGDGAALGSVVVGMVSSEAGKDAVLVDLDPSLRSG